MLKKINLLIFISLCGYFTQAQDWSLKLSSNVEIRSWKLTSTYEKEEKSLQGASITLTKGGQTVSQTTSDGNGDFTIMVPPNGEFLLTVSYPGYNTKRFSVNTNNVPPEFAKEDYKPTFSIGGFIMAKPFPGIDYSGLEQPLVLVQFLPKRKLFDHDEIVTGNGLSRVMKIADDETKLIQKFCGKNKSGDAALAKPDCPLAKTLYQEAMTIIPFEGYPVEQLKKVGDCLKNKNDAAEKAAADKLAAEASAKAKADADAVAKAKVSADATSKAKTDAQIKAQAEADKLAKQKEGMAKAKAEDNAEARAIEEKRKEKEAKQKEATAKAKAEGQSEAKATAEKKKEKEAKQKEGLAKAKAEDMAEAKALEEKRRAKENEDKKIKYETKSSDVQGEQDKRDTKKSVPSTVFGVDKYKETIKKADDYFKMKRWAEAKPVYEEALKIRVDDPYAKSKLEIVEKNLNTAK